MNSFITSGIDHMGNIGLPLYAVSKYGHMALYNTLKSLSLTSLSLKHFQATVVDAIFQVSKTNLNVKMMSLEINSVILSMT